jgi:hypothetical protein
MCGFTHHRAPLPKPSPLPPCVCCDCDGGAQHPTGRAQGSTLTAGPSAARSCPGSRSTCKPQTAPFCRPAPTSPRTPATATSSREVCPARGCVLSGLSVLPYMRVWMGKGELRGIASNCPCWCSAPWERVLHLARHRCPYSSVLSCVYVSVSVALNNECLRPSSGRWQLFLLWEPHILRAGLAVCVCSARRRPPPPPPQPWLARDWCGVNDRASHPPPHLLTTTTTSIPCLARCRQRTTSARTTGPCCSWRSTSSATGAARIALCSQSHGCS